MSDPTENSIAPQGLEDLRLRFQDTLQLKIRQLEEQEARIQGLLVTKPRDEAKPYKAPERRVITAISEMLEAEDSIVEELLVHICQCQDADCQRMNCDKMKRVVKHLRLCKGRIKGTCAPCGRLIEISKYHAKQCPRAMCPVPFCTMLRQRMAFESQYGGATPSTGLVNGAGVGYSQGQQGQMLNGNSFQPQIEAVNARMKAARTSEEREAIFADLKKTPNLFHAFLRFHSKGPYSMPMAIPQQQQHPQQRSFFSSMGGGLGQVQQQVQQGQGSVDIVLRPQIAEVIERIRAAKSYEEREAIVQNLKRSPELYNAWLRALRNGPYSMMSQPQVVPTIANHQQPQQCQQLQPQGQQGPISATVQEGN